MIIKRVIFGDYVLIGGEATIVPGTIVGKDTLVGAISYSVYNQILEPGWVYFGMPAVKLKRNKYAEGRRNKITRRDVDDKKKFVIDHDINIEEDKKDLA